MTSLLILITWAVLFSTFCYCPWRGPWYIHWLWVLISLFLSHENKKKIAVISFVYEWLVLHLWLAKFTSINVLCSFLLLSCCSTLTDLKQLLLPCSAWQLYTSATFAPELKQKQNCLLRSSLCCDDRTVFVSSFIFSLCDGI